jgi:wyosine [tRNA(Phe)-imidazoG37] synthetase (radical SAM superfamily)
LAVITNGSLLWRSDVRADCLRADLVSIKVDSVEEAIWRRVDRPACGLELERILAGVRRFAHEYDGTLLTETMLVEGLNLDASALRHTADFLAKLAPTCAYLAVPTPPPANPPVPPPADIELVQAFEIFSRRLTRVELLVGEAVGAFGQAWDPVEDLLGILAVHPMRESEAREYLASGGADPEALDELIRRGAVARAKHRGQSFLVLRGAAASS